MTIGNLSGSSGAKVKDVAEWLELKCKEGHLTLRQAATKADLSHTTLAKIKNGSRPAAATLQKLAAAFSDDGENQMAALEDFLLTLCGYRSAPPEAKQSVPLARLVDKLSLFNDEQLKMVETLVDFCTTLVGDRPWPNNDQKH